MTSKMETLYNELVAKLEKKTNNASAKVWYYKFNESNPERLNHWLNRRQVEFRRMVTVKNMTADQFRLALHENQMSIQTILFN